MTLKRTVWENIQHAITIIEYMDRDLADSTMGNYPRYFEEYYNIVKTSTRSILIQSKKHSMNSNGTGVIVTHSQSLKHN